MQFVRRHHELFAHFRTWLVTWFTGSIHNLHNRLWLSLRYRLSSITYNRFASHFSALSRPSCKLVVASPFYEGPCTNCTFELEQMVHISHLPDGQTDRIPLVRLVICSVANIGFHFVVNSARFSWKSNNITFLWYAWYSGWYLCLQELVAGSHWPDSGAAVRKRMGGHFLLVS